MTRSAAAVLTGVAVLGAVGLAALALTRLVFPGELGGDNPSGLILMVVAIGLVAEGAAGYAAGRIAPSHPYGHAVGVAALLSLIVLASGTLSSEPFSVAVSQAGINLLQIPGLVLGAFVAKRLARENQVPGENE
ncbi:MAG: hypothetical protein OEM23_03470 [Gemmatimonadota bacterium]|nr:hypothetical protein [Gemmatimonadota bacterium]MDH3427472.1 hypothetical protein [Gemmatimonadota bacterium]